MRKYVDLHVHSNISDGELSFEDIVNRLYSDDGGILSITDHDFIVPVLDNNIVVHHNQSLIVVSGVEITCFHNNIKIKK